MIVFKHKWLKNTVLSQVRSGLTGPRRPQTKVKLEEGGRLYSIVTRRWQSTFVVVERTETFLWALTALCGGCPISRDC
jgi:hypothetical protein